jgi:hypothetical protein
MLRALLRFLGYLSLAIGFIAFVVDGARSVANKELTFLPISAALDAVMPHSQAGWQEAVKQRVPFLWDPVLVTMLAAPFFFAAAIIALIFLLLGKRPKARIGYSNRD